MKSVMACDTCGENLDTVPGLGLLCANGCSFDYLKPGRKAAPVVQQRICSTPGCGRTLSPGTAGDRCRACYQSQSVSGQQRAKVGVAEPKAEPKEVQPVMVATRNREKVTVERERVIITAAEGSTKTITLKSGGQITINIVADLFRLMAGDREFVLGLVDTLNAFEQGKPPSSFHHCACEHYKKAAETCIEMSDGTEMCMVCGEDVGKPHKPGCAQGVLEAAGVGS